MKGRRPFILLPARFLTNLVLVVTALLISGCVTPYSNKASNRTTEQDWEAVDFNCRKLLIDIYSDLDERRECYGERYAELLRGRQIREDRLDELIKIFLDQTIGSLDGVSVEIGVRRDDYDDDDFSGDDDIDSQIGDTEDFDDELDDEVVDNAYDARNNVEKSAQSSTLALPGIRADGRNFIESNKKQHRAAYQANIDSRYFSLNNAYNADVTHKARIRNINYKAIPLRSEQAPNHILRLSSQSITEVYKPIQPKEDEVVSYGQKTYKPQKRYFPRRARKSFSCRMKSELHCSLDFEMPRGGRLSDYQYYLKTSAEEAGGEKVKTKCKERRSKVTCSLKGDMDNFRAYAFKRALFG